MQAERHEARIHFDTERLRELDTQNAIALNDITQSEERLFAAEQEIATVAERLQTSQHALGKHQIELQTKRGALQEVEADLAARQETLRKLQSNAFASAQQLSSVRNEINSLDLQKQGNLVRLEKLSAEKVE